VTTTPGPGLVLLRHGAVASHRGDVPLTHEGRCQAEHAGRRLAGLAARRAAILVGPTLRAQQTGLLLLHGLASARRSIRTSGPTVSMALRNPDVYLAAQRVEMVSTAAAFADQVPGLRAADVTQVPFYSGFLSALDRIGFWMNSTDPPGENPDAVAARIATFTASLSQARGPAADLVVGVTYSPVLRAVARRYLGTDPGEPGYLSGYWLLRQAGGDHRLEPMPAE
jgi:broad specificity phosphatase PhoE